MKSLITTGLILLLSIQLLSQTTDEIPSPERVLVVYRANHTYSGSIANYYIQNRNIPASNVVPITIPNPGDYNCHWENEIAGEEIIGDDIAGVAAWNFVKQFISDPIEQHLNSTYYEGQLLKNVIRYIVLCKGMPLKIRQSQNYVWDSHDRNRVAVDALLCLMNQPTGWSFTQLHGTLDSFFKNPYYDADPRFTMDYRFMSNHFVNQQGWYLQYLVSRLDGDNLDDVDSLINRSVIPDMSGEKYWIIDDDPETDVPALRNEFVETHKRLKFLGFNLNPEEYISSNEWIVNNAPTWEKVMGYASFGSHAPMPELYILEELDFEYANGSIFNTIESFNGFSFGFGRAGQGLISDFIHTGGTGGGGHVYEPYPGGQTQDEIMFPAYALGYSIVEAAYQSIPYLAWQNTIVGDPLSRIYGCQNTVITSNTTIGSTDFNCDVTIPPGITLTIASGSTVNFNKNAELKLFGNLLLNDGAIINFNNYSELELRGNVSASSNTAYLNFNNRANLVLVAATNFNNLILAFSDESEFIIPENIELHTSSAYELFFRGESKFNILGTLTNNENGSINFIQKSRLLLPGIMNINENSSTNFYNEAVLEVFEIPGITSSLNLKENSTLNFNGSAQLSVATLANIFPGAILNFYDHSFIYATGDFICQGDPANKVIFNFSNSEVLQFQYSGGRTLIIDNASINNGEININRSHHMPGAEFISITNSTFSGCETAITFALNNMPLSNPAHIANCSFTDINKTGINIQQVSEIEIEHCTIDLNSSENSQGIIIRNNGDVIISDIIISDGGIGIASFSADDPELIENLRTNIFIHQCVIETDFGIQLNGQDFPINSINISGNHFASEKNGIVINDFNNYEVNISNNVLVGNSAGTSTYGISLMSGNEALVIYNSITNFRTGINLNIVNNPIVLENFISAVGLTSPYSGIVSISSNGEFRKNVIQNHHFGVELGSSSPNIAENLITDNKYYGIYISRGSFPDLGKTTSGEYTYPLTGYNTIRENGICDDRNAELHFIVAGAYLNQGCNTIADDRENSGGCDYTLLMDGSYDEGTIEAKENYWGDHPVYGHDPSHRFGSGISVNYDPYLEEPCTFTPSEDFLVLRTSGGIVIDTVYSSGTAPTELTDLQTRYKNANEFYYANQYSQARQEYEGIIQNYGSSTGSLQAYNRLYTLANLMSSTQAVFNQLKEFYLQKAGNQTDSLMIETLTHLSDLCLVSAEEYLPAINNFDEIAQQNPNTDIALYRQIDALTTALLLPQDSTLNKGILGKYSVNNLSDYTDKLTELLRTRGRSGIESKKDLLPTEYTLYQNYPNPFNPVTTIKYDLPNTSDVALAVYDILGRKIKELVNTKQQAGKYEVKFDASSLSSGVYIYQLITEKYMQSRKMILLK